MAIQESVSEDRQSVAIDAGDASSGKDQTIAMSDNEKITRENSLEAAKEEAPAQPPMEYPQGLQLCLIMLSVLISLFLGALDQVSQHRILPTHSETPSYLPSNPNPILMTYKISRPSSAPPSPASPTNSTASTKSPGTAQRTS